MELSSSSIKKVFLIFPETEKGFFYFRKWNFPASSLKKFEKTALV